MTEKQEKFIQLLVDQIGFRNSPYRSDYYLKVKERCGITGHNTSKVIRKLLDEKRLRYLPKLKQYHTEHISVTSLSAYTFCPASYAISETYEIPESHKMLLGEDLHKQQYLVKYLKYIQKQKLFEKRFNVKYPDTAHLYNSFYSDLLKSSIIFSGHGPEKTEPFYSNDKSLSGVPDYIFQRSDKTKFVVEEKHTWRREDIAAPFANNTIQMLGYIYGIEGLEVTYGYIIYFHKYTFTSKDSNIFQITKTGSKISDFKDIFQQVCSLRDGGKCVFDKLHINMDKCFHCSSRVLCKHKSGRFDTVRYPYYIT